MAYCLARAAIDRRLGPDAFRPEALGNAEVRALMARVHVYEAADLPKGPSGVATGAHISVHANGLEIVRSRLAAPGSAAAPLGDTDLLAKFTLCLELFCTPDVAAGHFSALLDLPGAADVATVLDPLFNLTATPSRINLEQFL
jgi:2-methylcitrate dehydratase PrpD